MAAGVVHHLEAVEVEIEQRVRFAVSPSFDEYPLQPALELLTIDQAGEHVVRRLVRKQVPQGLRFGDVAEHHHRTTDMFRPLPRFMQWPRRIFRRERAAVLAPVQFNQPLAGLARVKRIVNRTGLGRVGAAIGMGVVNQTVRLAPQQFVAGIAEHRQRGLVHEGAAPFAVEPVDALAGRFEQQPEACFALPQRFLGPLVLGDVPEQDRHPPLLRLVDAEGVDVVVATQRLGTVLEPHRLTCPRHAAIDVKPVRFVRRGDLAHSAPDGILDPGLPLERRIDLQETEIDGRAGGVHDHLDDAEPLVDRLKKRAIPLLALPQSPLGLPALVDFFHQIDVGRFEHLGLFFKLAGAFGHQ